MPCYDPRDREDDERARLASAILCAVFKYIQKNTDLNIFLHDIDWKAAGVTKKQALDWWQYHKKQDTLKQERKKLEAEQKIIERNHKRRKSHADE